MLEIYLELNVTYSVLWLLISFQEAPWYVLFYYVWTIITTWRSKCALFIRFTISKVTASYQYMYALCYCKNTPVGVHKLLLYFDIQQIRNFIMFHYFFITELCLSYKFWINLFVIFCNTIIRCSQVHLRPPESADLQHTVNIER